MPSVPELLENDQKGKINVDYKCKWRPLEFFTTYATTCGESQSEVAQSCPTLSDLMDCSLPGPSV